MVISDHAWIVPSLSSSEGRRERILHAEILNGRDMPLPDTAILPAMHSDFATDQLHTHGSDVVCSGPWPRSTFAVSCSLIGRDLALIKVVDSKFRVSSTFTWRSSPANASMERRRRRPGPIGDIRLILDTVLQRIHVRELDQ